MLMENKMHIRKLCERAISSAMRLLHVHGLTLLCAYEGSLLTECPHLLNAAMGKQPQDHTQLCSAAAQGLGSDSRPKSSAICWGWCCHGTAARSSEDLGALGTVLPYPY